MEYEQALIIRTDVGMKKGKMASQVAHASVLSAYKTLQKNPEIFHKWFRNMKKVVLKVKSKEELMKLKQMAAQYGLVSEIVKDAGRTQISPGTITALGIGPDEKSKIDKVIKTLKLL